MAFFCGGWAALSAIGAQWGGRFDRTERVAASGCRGNACWQDRSYSDRQPAAAGRRRGVLRQMRRRRRRQPAAAPWRRAAPYGRRPVRSAAGSLHKINRAAISGPQLRPTKARCSRPPLRLLCATFASCAPSFGSSPNLRALPQAAPRIRSVRRSIFFISSRTGSSRAAARSRIGIGRPHIIFHSSLKIAPRIPPPSTLVFFFCPCCYFINKNLHTFAENLLSLHDFTCKHLNKHINRSFYGKYQK